MTLFERLLTLPQARLRIEMAKLLRSYYPEVIETRDFVLAQGSIPIALVAHLDTVFETKNTFREVDLYNDRQKKVMFSPDGAGFDDRAGVYTIIKILKRGYAPSIILTTEEEKGAIGAQKLIREFPESPFPLKYIIQLDRQGEKDCVFYDCANPLFSNYISSFGFEEALGSFSDISIICPAWGIAGVNLSIGYENEHTYSEILHTDWFYSTLDKVSSLLDDHQNINNFDYFPAKPTYKKVYFGNICALCGSPLSANDNEFLCPECAALFNESPPEDSVDF
jgi:hypothetical protein